MAIWQFDIELTPRGASLPIITSDLYETPSLPELSLARAKHYLRQHYGEAWEMLPRWLVFGVEDGTRFDVGADTDGSGSVRARVDARSNPATALSQVCELAALLGCELYIPEQHAIMQPELALLQQVFRGSAAVRFAANPRAFFSESS